MSRKNPVDNLKRTTSKEKEPADKKGVSQRDGARTDAKDLPSSTEILSLVLKLMSYRNQSVLCERSIAPFETTSSSNTTSQSDTIYTSETTSTSDTKPLSEEAEFASCLEDVAVYLDRVQDKLNDWRGFVDQSLRNHRSCDDKDNEIKSKMVNTIKAELEKRGKQPSEPEHYPQNYTSCLRLISGEKDRSRREKVLKAQGLLLENVDGRSSKPKLQISSEFHFWLLAGIYWDLPEINHLAHWFSEDLLMIKPEGRV